MNEDEGNAIDAGMVHLPDRRGMFYRSRLQHEQEKQIIGKGQIEHVPETGKITETTNRRVHKEGVAHS
jgi:hypothetical protein